MKNHRFFLSKLYNSIKNTVSATRGAIAPARVVISRKNLLFFTQKFRYFCEKLTG